MLVNGERALAYVVNVDDVSSIEGANNIELARVGGWRVIVRKEEYKPGDVAIFVEIDSLLPETEWSEFLRTKKFRVKTYRLNKFNVTSQGLLLPMNILPDNKQYDVGDDVTKILGITYYVKEDNCRKSNKENPEEKYKRMAARHKKLAKYKWFRYLMKRNWGKRLLFIFFGSNKKDVSKKFPQWIKKTDEDRIENMPWMLEDKEPFVVTEKIDGTSTTVFLDTTTRKPDFGVCSRNVRQIDVEQENYEKDNAGTNVYWEMVFKYNMKDALADIAKKYNAKRVVIQGETYGESVQGNSLHLKERRFAAFNLVFNGERLGSLEAKKILDEYDIPFVPIVNESYIMPDDFDALKKEADGMSTINKRCKREGLVYRSLDGKQSAKSVSIEYLMKKKD